MISLRAKMGFGDQKDIFRKLHELAPGSFLKAFGGPPREIARRVIVSDGPTRLRYRLGPRFDYTFTGRDYYDMFMEPIREVMRAGVFWVECFDVEAIPNPEKKNEQIKRATSRSKSEAKKKAEGKSSLPRYPDETVFCEGGIRMPDGRVQFFDLRAVTASQALRQKLLVLVAQMLLDEPLPVGGSVILDCFEAGPLQFIRHPSARANICLHLEQYRSFFAESDHRLVMWSRIFAHADSLAAAKDNPTPTVSIEVRTIDSDLVAMLGSFVEDTQPRCPVFMDRGKIKYNKARKKDEPTHHPVIFINQLVETLNQAEITFEFLTAAFHLFGSDPVRKELLTAGSGFYASWPTLLRYKRQLTELDVDTGDLVARGKGGVWEKMLRHPVTHTNALAPVFFVHATPEVDLSVTESFSESKDKFQKCVDIVYSVCSALPRRKPPVKETDFREGVADLLFAIQWHRFPWHIVQVEPPSAFLETEDLS